MDQSSRRIINQPGFRSNYQSDQHVIHHSNSYQRIDQNFDSHDSFNETSFSRLGGGNPLREDLKKAESEHYKKTQQFNSISQPQLHPMKTDHLDSRRYPPIPEVEPSRSPERNPGNSSAYGSVIINNRNVDLDPIMSQSNKFEESFKAHGRQPQYIPGLTDFLTKEHYKRIGVFNKKETTLFNFWKSYVSAAYRERRDLKLQSKAGFNESAINGPQQSFAHKSMRSNKQVKENIIDPNNENSILHKYKKFQDLYEMDVRYTIQTDVN